MRFWQGAGLIDFLVLSALLLFTYGLFRYVPLLRRLAIPQALFAGLLALLLGPGVLGWIQLDTSSLEVVVYHALALLFISMGLRTSARRGLSPGARSIAFAVPFVTVVQAAVGLGIVLAWSSFVSRLHPGIGWMLPLGFSQGPGQALSMGASWEASGFENGGQIGLIMAAAGYGWCIVAGVALFHIGRLRGWAASDQGPIAPVIGPPEVAEGQRGAIVEVGDIEPLTLHVAQVGAVYLLVYLILSGIASLLASKPGLAAMIWGFHFIFGLMVAIAVRWVRDNIVRRVRPLPQALVEQQDALLSRLGGLSVDVAAAAALAAVRMDLLLRYWPALLVISTVGGLVTVVLTIWLSRRAFPEDPFDHALVLFGMSSGTLPTGLVLLRLKDPGLVGAAANDVVMGVTGALVLAAPLLLVVLPMPILGWPGSFPSAVWQTLGVLIVYAVALLVGWRYLGPLRMTRPWLSLWPRRR